MIYLKKFNEGIRCDYCNGEGREPSCHMCGKVYDYSDEVEYSDEDDLDREGIENVEESSRHIHLNEGDNVLVLTQDELDIISSSLNFFQRANKRLSSEEAKRYNNERYENLLTKISLSKTTTDQCKNMMTDLESMNHLKISDKKI